MSMTVVQLDYENIFPGSSRCQNWSDFGKHMMVQPLESTWRRCFKQSKNTNWKRENVVENITCSSWSWFKNADQRLCPRVFESAKGDIWLLINVDRFRIFSDQLLSSPNVRLTTAHLHQHRPANFSPNCSPRRADHRWCYHRGTELTNNHFACTQRWLQYYKR